MKDKVNYENTIIAMKIVRILRDSGLTIEDQAKVVKDIKSRIKDV
jgi:hypothetical protein